MTTRLLVVIEGCIATGKTTFAQRLASLLHASLLLEDYHQVPSLPDFYEDPSTHAYVTEMEFTRYHFGLLNRLVRQEGRGTTVVDFSLLRDLVFASITLRGQSDNLARYRRYWHRLNNLSPKPSVVVLLEAPVEVLLQRITARARPFELAIEPEYLQAVSAGIRDVYASRDRVIRIDTSDFAWLNANLDQLAEDVRRMLAEVDP